LMCTVYMHRSAASAAGQALVVCMFVFGIRVIGCLWCWAMHTWLCFCIGLRVLACKWSCPGCWH
jgi:hypothetical protein